MVFIYKTVVFMCMTIYELARRKKIVFSRMTIYKSLNEVVFIYNMLMFICMTIYEFVMKWCSSVTCKLP